MTYADPREAAAAKEKDAQENLAKLVAGPVSGQVLVGAACTQVLIAISYRLADLADAVRSGGA